MAIHGYENFSEFVNDLIDGKVDGNFNPSADGEYDLNIDNFNGTAFSGIEDMRDEFWKELLEYMYKEDENLGHSIVRDDDWGELIDNIETVFQYINSHADLDNGSDKSFYTQDEFNEYSDEDNETYDSTLSKYDSYEDYVHDYIEANYLSYIQNYIDEGDPHWNESLSALVAFYQKYFEDIDDLDEIEYNSDGTVADSNGNINMGDGFVEFRTDDIIHGDAGNYFARTAALTNGTYGDDVVAIEDYAAAYSKDIEIEKDKNDSSIYRIDKDKTWVRPWFNIDGSTYSIERGKDKIKRVLNDNRNLQFTRYKENEQDYIDAKLSESEGIDATLEKYLRLIMPMYERIVEIEDIDRNFWVIAQVLGGLSAYVLGDDSPIGNMFAGLIDEVVQLWENILYLWVAMGLISQDPYYTDIKKLFIPVYNSEQESYIKFDNFSEWSFDNIFSNGTTADTYCLNTLKSIWEEDKNIQILKDEYNESSLIIAPEIRQKNYFKNYYAQVIYPGLIIYNRNTNSTYYIRFNTKKNYDGKTYTTPIYIDLTNENEPIREKLIGFYEDKEYYYFSNFQDIDTSEQLYKTLVRTTLDIEASITNEYEIEIDFSTLSFNFYDVARELSGALDCLIGTAATSSGTIIEITDSTRYTFDFNVNTLSSVNSYVEKDKGYYQGELLSYVNEKEFEIISSSLEAITYHPQVGYSNIVASAANNITSFEEYISYMQGQNGRTAWVNIVESEAESDLIKSGMVKLYYCNSAYDSSYTGDSFSSKFEMKPYLTFAINKNGILYYYHFIQKVTNNGLNNLILYPYVSSAYESEGNVESASIGKLCLFSRSNPGSGLVYSSSNYQYTGDTEVFFIAPRNERFYTYDGIVLDTTGISIYGNMDVAYEDSNLYLKNYAIIIIDRCRLSTTSAIDSSPYYYLCSVTSAPHANGWGVITCEYTENSDSLSNCYSTTGSNTFYSLNSSGNIDIDDPQTLTTYYWNTNWQNDSYMNNYSDANGEGNLSYSSSYRNDFESSISNFNFSEYVLIGGV